MLECFFNLNFIIPRNLRFFVAGVANHIIQKGNNKEVVFIRVLTPYYRPTWWFNDDKTIVALVVTQGNTPTRNYSAAYQKYANKIGTVVVSSENGYHHTNYKFGVTTETFNAQSATRKYE